MGVVDNKLTCFFSSSFKKEVYMSTQSLSENVYSVVQKIIDSKMVFNLFVYVCNGTVNPRP